MNHEHGIGFHRRLLLARFLASAAGFWTGRSAWRVWLLCATLIVITVAQLTAQYWLNYWNRDFFDALAQKNFAGIKQTVLLFFPLVILSTTLAVCSVWARMTTQRNWRRYLTRHLISRWLAQGHYRFLGTLNGTEIPQNPEYRIAEDARVATDAPIDLALALLSSIMTVVVFFNVLSNVGGSITVHMFGSDLTIRNYLSISVVVYSGLITSVILLIGRHLTVVVQDQMQAEAAFRATANLIRESGEGIILNENSSDTHRRLWAGLHNVIDQWRRLCWQLVRTTCVTHANSLFTPAIGLLLCAPKYLNDEMSLGEVTQAAAAFATVQGAFNWFVDNFQRMADWRSSANRVAALLLVLDEVSEADSKAPLVIANGRS